MSEQPYFCEGSDAMMSLESMIDRAGIRNVMYALAHICREKAAHLESGWQDAVGAKVWGKRAAFFDDKAGTILMSDA